MGGPGSGRKKGSGKDPGHGILISKKRKMPDIKKTENYNKAKRALDKAKAMKMGPTKNKIVKDAEAALQRASK